MFNTITIILSNCIFKAIYFMIFTLHIFCSKSEITVMLKSKIMKSSKSSLSSVCSSSSERRSLYLGLVSWPSVKFLNCVCSRFLAVAFPSLPSGSEEFLKIRAMVAMAFSRSEPFLRAVCHVTLGRHLTSLSIGFLICKILKGYLLCTRLRLWH